VVGRYTDLTTMQEKQARIVGMVAFIALAVFLVWHVDYGTMETVGFQTSPHGYDSIAYKCAKAFYPDQYGYGIEAGNWWIWTQLLPIGVAWLLRKSLGKCMNFLSRAAKRIYSSA
jgi:hypothetical protein